jgi:hypothetical protein
VIKLDKNDVSRVIDTDDRRITCKEGQFPKLHAISPPNAVLDGKGLPVSTGGGQTQKKKMN